MNDAFTKKLLRQLRTIYPAYPIVQHAVDEIDRLTAENARLTSALMIDHTEKLAAFAREVIRDAWNHDIDGGGVQAAAEHHGLIVHAIYDPEEHGDGIDAELGDEILVFADWLKMLTAPNP